MVTKGILYYTDNRLQDDIAMACRSQLLKIKNGHELGCVALGNVSFDDWNICLELAPSVLTMHKQIMYGLSMMDAEVVFMCEHDVLYHPSHFEFTPSSPKLFYYNTNVWKVRYPDGHAVWTDDLQQISGLCAYRKLLLDFFKTRVETIESIGFNRHFEPGPKNGNYKTENWQSAYPNLDIRHIRTLTKSKWSPDEFRNPKYANGWKEMGGVDGWYEEGQFSKLLG